MLLMDMFGCLGFRQVLLVVVPVRRLRIVSQSFRYGSEGVALLDGPLVAVSWYVEQMVDYRGILLLMPLLVCIFGYQSSLS